MKLVMTHDTGNGYTDSEYHTCPFEYESLESAYVDFMEHLNRYRQILEKAAETDDYYPLIDNQIKYVMFAGMDFDLSCFQEWDINKNGKQVYTWSEPEFYTLEDWFEKHKSRPKSSCGKEF